MIEFLWPWVFLLLIAFPIVRFLISSKQVAQAALTVPDAQDFSYTDKAKPHIGGKLRWFRVVVLFLAWAALVTALARPQWSGEPIPLPTTGRDMFLAMDISQSMSLDDMMIGGQLVTRLVALKYVVQSFVESREGDRLGLILFGTRAYVYVPLTFDIQTLNLLLQEAPIGIAGGQTSIGDTIGLAVKRLLERPVDHRILILMTDGSHNEGALSPAEATDLAIEAKVRIHTIGIGAERDIGRQGGFGRYRSFGRGAFMDTENLQRIASETGGKFFRASSTESLAEVYQEISKLEPIEQNPQTLRPTKSLFHWALGISLGLFALLWGIRR